MMTYLTLADIAAMIGVTEESAQVYHTRAVRHRRDGSPQPGDMPPPDRTFSRTPVWTPETVQRWIAARPGTGNYPRETKSVDSKGGLLP
jgi:hypothetical protein